MSRRAVTFGVMILIAVVMLATPVRAINLGNGIRIDVGSLIIEGDVTQLKRDCVVGSGKECRVIVDILESSGVGVCQNPGGNFNLNNAAKFLKPLGELESLVIDTTVDGLGKESWRVEFDPGPDFVDAECAKQNSRWITATETCPRGGQEAIVRFDTLAVQATAAVCLDANCSNVESFDMATWDCTNISGIGLDEQPGCSESYSGMSPFKCVIQR
jgi:hypothetical protein